MRLVSAVLEGTKSAYTEAKIIDVCDLDIEYCNAQEHANNQKDDFRDLYNEMLASDGMI